MSEVTTAAAATGNGLRNAKGQFLRGHSGLPGGGRPLGSRARIGEAFLLDLRQVWAVRGRDALERAALEEPARFAQIVAHLLPDQIEVGGPNEFASCASCEEVISRLLSDFDDPRDALAGLETMRELVLERIAELERQALPPPRARAAE